MRLSVITTKNTEAMSELKTPFLDKEIEEMKDWIEHTEAITHNGIFATRAMLKEYEAIKKRLERYEEAMKERAIEFSDEIASLYTITDDETDKEIERRYNEKYGSDANN